MTGEKDFLRTREEDIEFHTSRMMFWIINGEVIVGPTGTRMSHLEMAETHGWINGENTDVFFQKNIRGFRIKNNIEDRVHFYRGIGFGFDEEMKTEVRVLLPILMETLGLTLETKVYFGPKDSIINGVEYPISFEGEVSHLFQEK